MADRDVQMVRIIVGDRLPVELARAQRCTAADRAQILEAIGRDLVLIGRHHLGHARRAGLERDEQEPAPILERDRHQPKLARCRAPDIRARCGTPTSRRRGHSSTRDRGRSAPWRSRPRHRPAATRGGGRRWEGAHLAVVAAHDDDRFRRDIRGCATRPARRSRSRGRRSAARRAGTPRFSASKNSGS